uniref:Putative leptin receptor protein-related protein n=1 Tax=Nyssomyia neivai TaxID=330878 RepID=A0A1L8DK75_9DIPT
MAGVKALVLLAFAGSIGMTLVILACALPQYQLWWPLFVILFYVLSPVPTIVAKRFGQNNQSTSCVELAVFLTMGLIVSCFALPIVLTRTGTILAGACYLTLCGNVVVYITLLGYFLLFDADDSDYGLW